MVKTHEWGELAFKMFGTAILLVRDPKSAIVAEFNRQSAGHVGFASVERFRRRCEYQYTGKVPKIIPNWSCISCPFICRLAIVRNEQVVALGADKHGLGQWLPGKIEDPVLR